MGRGGRGWQATLRRDDDGLAMLDLYCNTVRCDTSPVSSDLLQLLQSTGGVGAFSRGPGKLTEEEEGTRWFTGYFQIVLFLFLFLIPGGNHAELLYISYASVRVQCVREGSKKVQKD